MLPIGHQFALATNEETLGYFTQISLLYMIIKELTDYPNKKPGDSENKHLHL